MRNLYLIVSLFISLNAVAGSESVDPKVAKQKVVYAAFGAISEETLSLLKGGCEGLIKMYENVLELENLSHMLSNSREEAEQLIHLFRAGYVQKSQRCI